MHRYFRLNSATIIFMSLFSLNGYDLVVSGNQRPYLHVRLGPHQSLYVSIFDNAEQVSYFRLNSATINIYVIIQSEWLRSCRIRQPTTRSTRTSRTPPMFQIVHDQSRFVVIIEQRTDSAEKLGVDEASSPFPMKIFVVFLVTGVEFLHAIGQIANCPEVLHVNVRVRWRHLAVVVGVSSHYYRDYVVSEEEKKRRKEGIVLFNDALNTFYLRLYGEREKCFI